jgi:hypothetical protein
MSAPTPRPRSEWRPLPEGWSWSVRESQSPYEGGGVDTRPVAVHTMSRRVAVVTWSWEFDTEMALPIPVVLAVLHAAGYGVSE